MTAGTTDARHGKRRKNTRTSVPANALDVESVGVKNDCPPVAGTVGARVRHGAGDSCQIANSAVMGIDHGHVAPIAGAGLGVVDGRHTATSAAGRTMRPVSHRGAGHCSALGRMPTLVTGRTMWSVTVTRGVGVGSTTSTSAATLRSASTTRGLWAGGAGRWLVVESRKPIRSRNLLVLSLARFEHEARCSRVEACACRRLLGSSRWRTWSMSFWVVRPTCREYEARSLRVGAVRRSTTSKV